MDGKRIEDTVTVVAPYIVANVHGEEVQEDERIEDNIMVDGAMGNVHGEERPPHVPYSSSEEDHRIDDDGDGNVSDERVDMEAKKFIEV